MVDKAKKQKQVEELNASLSSATTVVIANYTGLTIPETDELRNAARKAKAGIKVSKNTLARIASKGTKHENIIDLFSGQSLVAYSDDAVAAAKVVADFAKKNEKLSIVGGSFNGDKLDAKSVKDLAQTPSLDESRGRIVGLLVASAGQIARIVNEPASQLARVFSAYGEKQ
ncbi:MAG TPA: 50S ribosomal protein L10 [Alphaproteobacteria bacterium]|nr:50S ribosomal protein L10 [Alphaproteobacteria bacterium]